MEGAKSSPEGKKKQYFVSPVNTHVHTRRDIGESKKDMDAENAEYMSESAACMIDLKIIFGSPRAGTIPSTHSLAMIRVACQLFLLLLQLSSHRSPSIPMYTPYQHFLQFYYSD